jgi:ATP-dependent Lon protease
MQMECPLLPVKNVVLYPSIAIPLIIGRESSHACVDAVNATKSRQIIIVAQRHTDAENPGLNDIYRIATLGVIKSTAVESEHELNVTIVGERRVKILSFVKEKPYFVAHYEELPPIADNGHKVEALQRVIWDQIEKIQDILQLQANYSLLYTLQNLRDPLEQVYLLAYLVSLDLDKRQNILEANSREEALALMNRYLSHEVQILRLRKKITGEVSTQISAEQRKYYLRQQLKAIKEELGEETTEQADLAQLREKLKKSRLPENAEREAQRELRRLEGLPLAAPDYQLTKSYLELISELPWQQHTVDNLDLNHARQILDEDHYGLGEVKARVVEFLAVLKLNPQASAPIICFQGPPGVGKTSLGTSIARALGRKFERQSLGGLHDEAELRGHRRTYIGSMPGRIIQAIRRAGTNNPLLMLDEVDKLGRDFRGDPAAALLEILDPNQNKEFRDNYLDLPFDLSKVFFITTANTLDTIPAPLLDRMEVIPLSGYTEMEKLVIAKRYLLPRQLRQSGLKSAQVKIPDATISAIIRNYTHEGGVRELERTLGKVVRKVAIIFADGSKATKLTVSKNKLRELLGPEMFTMEKARKKLSPGIAAGLAYTSSGGDVLYIETSFLPGENTLRLTGSLGEVMKESAQTALTYIWSQAEKLKLAPDLLKKTGIHIHVPAGATPKDGPSAGITIACALASLYLKKPLKTGLAMTGEITLSGLVLPVGGLKEKILAAKRSRIKTIILPAENREAFNDINPALKEGLQFIFVKKVSEVFAVAMEW